MQKEIIKYPNPKIRLISANVRFFNDELKSQIHDMMDTMEAGGLNALSAILIGIQYNILVIKENNIYKPYINARIIRHEGMVTDTERSPYYDGISVDVDRYEKISVVYENENGESNTAEFDGQAAKIFQHYLDYSFGSTFVDRVSKGVKQQINDYLEFGLVQDASGGACPTVFYRDYAKRAVLYSVWLSALCSIASHFLVGISGLLYSCAFYLLCAVPFLIVVYMLYARYETQKYKQCTSCQTGNIVGVSAILVFWLLISTAIYFLASK